MFAYVSVRNFHIKLSVKVFGINIEGTKWDRINLRTCEEQVKVFADQKLNFLTSFEMKVTFCIQEINF